MFQKLAAEKGKREKTQDKRVGNANTDENRRMRLRSFCTSVALGLLRRKSNRPEAFFVILPNRPLQTRLFDPPDALFDCAVDNTTHKKNRVHANANCASQPCFLQNKKYNRQKKIMFTQTETEILAISWDHTHGTFE